MRTHPLTPWLAATLLAATAATAQPAAGALDTVARSQWPGDAATDLPGCAATPATTPLGQTLAQLCAVPAGGSATLSSTAYFERPSQFNPQDPGSYALARLGAASIAQVEVMSRAGGTPHDWRDPVPTLQGQGFARYTDYLVLGSVMPAQLTLSFHLSGELRLGSVFEAGHVWQADTSYAVAVQSGHFASDGVFGSFAPYARGGVTVSRQLRSGLSTPEVTPRVTAMPEASLGFAELTQAGGGTEVRLTLGRDFFDNPANPVLMLDLQLLAHVHAPAWSFANLSFGTVLTGNEVAADYASTFVMTGLQALDADDRDITASAVVGFQSLLAVPEPGSAALWLTGGLALLGLSRARRSSAAAGRPAGG